MRTIRLGLIVMALAALSFAQGRKTLDVYVIDVEGGKADLWVTPAGQAILLDTATGGDRDLNRILGELGQPGFQR